MKDNIINIAKELFAKHGYQKVNMFEIADELGISKRTLYKFFNSKESLFEEIVRLCIEDIDKKQNAVIKEESNSFTKLTKLSKLYLNVGMLLNSANYNMLRLYFPKIYNEWKILASKSLHYVKELLIDCKNNEEPVSYPIDLIAELFISIQLEYGTSIIYDDKMREILSEKALIIKLMLNGLSKSSFLNNNTDG